MSTTEQRLAANRANAMLSSGPITENGKLVASQNATRHGILSTRLLLDGEDPADFEALFAELCQTLAPVGTMELVLVERIAITLWRQRRLVIAESASLALSRLPKGIAAAVSKHLDRGYGSELRTEDLLDFDPERAQWCRSVLAELDVIKEYDLDTLQRSAPLTYQQICNDAKEDEQPVAAFLSGHKGGPGGYLGELLLLCRQQISQAEGRPQIQALAEQVRSKRLLLSDDALDVIARYQTTLDNQLYKGLRALRDAQEWRLKLLDATPNVVGQNLEPQSEAA